MYLTSILWLLSWPVLVVVAYHLVKYTILKYELILDKPVKKSDGGK